MNADLKARLNRIKVPGTNQKLGDTISNLVSGAILMADAPYPATDVTATKAEKVIGFCPVDGTISNIRFRLANRGTDGSNPLSLTLDVFKNGTSIFTGTLPSINKYAVPTGSADTSLATTGVVDFADAYPVDSTSYDVSAGDRISYSLTLVRTATPADEMADPAVQVEIAPDTGSA